MRRGISLVSLAVLFVVTTSLPLNSKTISMDLREAKSIRIKGAHKVATAGDVNGDRIPDVLVSEGDFLEGPTEGRVYVVFGQVADPFIDLDELGDQGFVIYGAEEEDYASEADGAGDINGDGLDDIVVGAFGAENNGREGSGSVYVIFGKKTTEPVHLRDFDLNIQGERGYRIDGAGTVDNVGYSVAGLGDVNGDGVGDIGTVALSGRAAYVLFGQREPPPLPIDLLTFHLGVHGSTGFRFDLSRSPSEYSVAPGGDVNGDGLKDLVVGVGRPEYNTFVVFGKKDNTPLSSDSLGTRGIVVRHGGEGAFGIGDVNGDGLSDLFVGVNVIFGQRRGGKISRSQPLGPRGYSVSIAVKDIAGSGPRSTGPAGDVDGDGLADMLYGAPYTDSNGRESAGSVYVLYGKKGTATIDVRRLGSDGYRIDGPAPGEGLGYSVAGLDDLNGDGVPDHLLAAPGHTRDGGSAYIVWGRR
jgi:hypothetical protein